MTRSRSEEEISLGSGKNTVRRIFLPPEADLADTNWKTLILLFRECETTSFPTSILKRTFKENITFKMALEREIEEHQNDEQSVFVGGRFYMWEMTQLT